MENKINERIRYLIKEERETYKSFAEKIGVSENTLKTIFARDSNPNLEIIIKIANEYPSYSLQWLITGRGERHSTGTSSFFTAQPEETRPRIPLNAAAGSLSVAQDGGKEHDCEAMPVIKAFSTYDFTILARGDSMEPEFHSGDELACLRLRNTGFIQWGRYHVLDTSQGIIVKRIFEEGEYILCRSDESQLYKDFKIHKSEIYNLALVIGMLRRY